MDMAHCSAHVVMEHRASDLHHTLQTSVVDEGCNQPGVSDKAVVDSMHAFQESSGRKALSGRDEGRSWIFRDESVL